MRAVRFFDGALSLTLILASRWTRSSHAGRVQCREHPCGGGLVGAQQNHQHVDEKAFAVRPAADQVSHQCENEAGTAAASMSKSGLEAACRHTWQSVRTCRPVNLIVRLRHGSISKDIVAKVGRHLFCNYNKKNVTFLLLFCCSSLASGAFLSQSRFLAFPWNKSKVLCTI